MSTDLGTLRRSRFLWKNGKEGDLGLGQVEIFKERDQRCNWLYEKVKRDRNRNLESSTDRL